MFRYECTHNTCTAEGRIPVYWSEGYVNARTNKRTIKEREEEMTRLHSRAYFEKHIVKRKKVKT